MGKKTEEVLTRVHEFLGRLCRDGRCDDHCSECIGASDLADDVWEVLHEKKAPDLADVINRMQEFVEAAKCGMLVNSCAQYPVPTYNGMPLQDVVNEWINAIVAAWEGKVEAMREFWTKKCRDTIAEHDRSLKG